MKRSLGNLIVQDISRVPPAHSLLPPPTHTTPYLHSNIEIYSLL